MTTTEKQIELAKMDGKVYHKPTPEEIASGSYYQYEPDYTSYNAIIPLIQKQDAVTILLISRLVEAEMGTARHFSDLQATPEQLCDALLKAKGFEV